MWRTTAALACVGSGALCALLAGPARGVDGVLEIHQACAELTGCFSGDAPGFPVEISAPGSYRLTGNLAPTAGPVDVIEIGADGVSLDLGGFEIQGATTCTETGAVPNSVNCTPGGLALNGVLIGSHERVEIRNGVIRGMSSLGIEGSLADAAVVREMRLMHNGAGGVIANLRSRIVDVVASLNGGSGISVGPASAIFRSEAMSNDGNGIQADEGVEVVECRASGNVGTGIFANDEGSVIDRNRVRHNGAEGVATAGNAVVSRNAVAGNQAQGIVTGDNAVIDHNAVTRSQGDGIRCGSSCTVSRNSSTDHQSGGNGIVVLSGSSVWGNTVSGNDGDGLVLGVDSAYDHNVSSGNSGTDVSGSGTSLGNNLCSGGPC